jgi:hypothetical protein
MMKYIAVALGLLCIACGRSSAASDQLSKYAGTDLTKKGNYVDFYAQAMHMPRTDRSPEKLRAYYLATRRTPDAGSSCANLDCAVKEIQSQGSGSQSALQPFAVYHLAELAVGQNQFDACLALIAEAKSPPKRLARKLSLLKGRVLFLTNAGAAEKHFKTHIETYPDADSLYLAAAAFERSGNKPLAVETAQRALEHPGADSPFAHSGLIIRNVLGKGIYEIPNTLQRIRLMESLRVAKDPRSAYKLYLTLKDQSLPASEMDTFIHYAARLLINRGEFGSVRTLLSTRANLLEAGNERSALDICERLLRKRQYGIVQSIYAGKSTKSALQCVLRMALRSGKIDSSVRPVAAEYLTKFDGASTLAERVYMRSCLPLTTQNLQRPDTACLSALQTASTGLAVGAGARYYLAKFYDAAGDESAARKTIEELVQQYSDDYYFYRLLEAPLQLKKQWSAQAANPSSRNEKIIAAVMGGDLNLAQNVEPLAALTRLERDVRARLKDLDDDSQLALLLFAADSRGEARELLHAEDRTEVYEKLISLGILADKPDISIYGMKQWLKHKKLRPFLYEIPPFLRDILYPTKFSAHIDRFAGKYHIDPAEVLALIRQESQFFPGAQSVAHAKGLMQLLPATAKLVARREGMKTFDLFKPEDNIRLGIGYMRDIREYYTPDFLGVAVAYNAGPGRYTQWKRKLSSDPDLYVEQIPFQETYQYVKVLLTDRSRYRALLRQKP